jgi:hypothetical protein
VASFGETVVEPMIAARQTAHMSTRNSARVELEVRRIVVAAMMEENGNVTW